MGLPLASVSILGAAKSIMEFILFTKKSKEKQKDNRHQIKPGLY